MTEEAQPTTMSAHAALTRAKAAERRVEELEAEAEQRRGQLNAACLRESAALARAGLRASELNAILAALRSAGIETDDPAAGVRELAAQRDRALQWKDEYALLSAKHDRELARNIEPSRHDYIDNPHHPGTCHQAVFEGNARRCCGYPRDQHRGPHIAAPPPSDKAPAPEPERDIFAGVRGKGHQTFLMDCAGELDDDDEPAEAEPSAPGLWVPAGEHRYRIADAQDATLCMVYPHFDESGDVESYGITVDGCGAYPTLEYAMDVAARRLARIRNAPRTPEPAEPAPKWAPAQVIREAIETHLDACSAEERSAIAAMVAEPAPTRDEPEPGSYSARVSALLDDCAVEWDAYDDLRLGVGEIVDEMERDLTAAQETIARLTAERDAARRLLWAVTSGEPFDTDAVNEAIAEVVP